MKDLWNIRVTMTPIVVGTLGMVPRGLEEGLDEMEIRGRIKIIQTTALLKSEYSKESWSPEETSCHSDSSEGSTTNTGMKNSQGKK